MIALLRFLFFNVLVRFVVLVVLGINLRHGERLPRRAPAVLVANHNSHLDTMVLMTLLGARLLPAVQPVAARDYFLRHRLLAWFALNIIGILPLKRRPDTPGEDVLAPVHAALNQGKILIFFPEGSRGRPEEMSDFKSGIARVAERNPEVPVIPIFLHGLGKALPKGEALFVPFFCDIFVGEAIVWQEDRRRFMDELRTSIEDLAAEGEFSPWD